MQAVGIILVLISLGTTIGPVGAVVVMYSNNLQGLVIPPEVQAIMDGNSTIIATNVITDEGQYENGTADLGPMGFVMPTFVSATVDTATKSFTVTVNVTDFLNYDLTLNAINATVQSTENGNQLATIHLASPVVIPAGQSDLVTVSGEWTQAAEDYITNHPGANSINVTLSNAALDINGIVVQTSEPIQIGEIPLTITLGGT